MPQPWDATARLVIRPPNWGLLDAADARAEVTGADGSAAVVTLRIAADGTVAEARFKTRGVRPVALFGRVVAATEGRPAAAVARWQVGDAAGAMRTPAPGIGPEREAIELACTALRTAIAARGAPGVPSAAPQADRQICYCMDVTAERILGAVRGGCRSVADVTAKTGAGGGCGTCRPDIVELLRTAGIASPEQGSGPPWAPGRLPEAP